MCATRIPQLIKAESTFFFSPITFHRTSSCTHDIYDFVSLVRANNRPVVFFFSTRDRRHEISYDLWACETRVQRNIGNDAAGEPYDAHALSCTLINSNSEKVSIRHESRPRHVRYYVTPRAIPRWRRIQIHHDQYAVYNVILLPGSV